MCVGAESEGSAAAVLYNKPCEALKGQASRRGADLVPSLHGPLPPLEQEALLPVGLLHAGRGPAEALHDLPAVLEGDAASRQDER